MMLSRIPLVLLAFLLAAPAARAEFFGRTINEAKARQLVTDGKVAEAARMYAELGELHLVRHGLAAGREALPEGSRNVEPRGDLELADLLFEQALKLDPTNAKANLLSALVTKPGVALRGFAIRAAGLSEKLRAAFPRYGMFLRAELPATAAFAPLSREMVSRDGAASRGPLATYADLQRFYRHELLPAMTLAADRLNTLLYAKEFKVRLSESGFRCDFAPTTGYQCILLPDFHFFRREQHEGTFTVDGADVKALRGAYLAMIDLIRANTAYDLDGLDTFLGEIAAARANGARLSTREIAGMLRKHPKLFTLEKDNELAKLPAETGEALRHAMDLAAVSRELCGNSHRARDLFASICFASEELRALRIATDVLDGPRMVELSGVGGPEILIDVAGIVAHPPRDLKALLPTDFDDAGEPVRYKDPTMGGLFPNGDLFQKLGGKSRFVAGSRD